MLITNRERIGTWEWEGIQVGLGGAGTYHDE
jgi:hypothetical protein